MSAIGSIVIFILIFYQIIGVLAGDMEVEGNGVVTICADGEVIEPGRIPDKGIVRIDEVALVVDAEVDLPFIVGPEFKGTIFNHVGRYGPDLIGCVIAHLGIVVPAAGCGVADDAPGGLCCGPGVVGQVGRQFIVAAGGDGEASCQAVGGEGAIAAVAVVDMVPV